MNFLSIDTSSPALSVALSCGQQVFFRHELAARKQSEQLLPWLNDLLAEAGIDRTMLDGVACGIGPGTFAGLRLAVSAAQALSAGLNIPAVGVSSLAALAHFVSTQAHAPCDIVVTLDARQSEIYVRMVRLDEHGHTLLLDDCLQDPTQWQPPIGDHHVFVAGSGLLACDAALHSKLAQQPNPAGQTLLPDLLPDARSVLALAKEELTQAASQNLTLPPLQPAYVRQKVAETMTERGLPEPRLPHSFTP